MHVQYRYNINKKENKHIYSKNIFLVRNEERNESAKKKNTKKENIYKIISGISNMCYVIESEMPS